MELQHRIKGVNENQFCHNSLIRITVEIRPKPSVRKIMGFIPMVACVFVSVVLAHRRKNRKPNALRYGIFTLGVKTRPKPWTNRLCDPVWNFSHHGLFTLNVKSLFFGFYLTI